MIDCRNLDDGCVKIRHTRSKYSGWHFFDLYKRVSPFQWEQFAWVKAYEIDAESDALPLLRFDWQYMYNGHVYDMRNKKCQSRFNELCKTIKSVYSDLVYDEM